MAGVGGVLGEGVLFVGGLLRFDGEVVGDAEVFFLVFKLEGDDVRYFCFHGFNLN